MDRRPREWAAELRRPALSGDPLFAAAANFAARWLIQADRLVPAKPMTLPALLGASIDRSGDIPDGRLRLVSLLQDLSDTAADARPGDVIEIRPGRYHFAGGAIHFGRPGTAIAPITVRAARLGDVIIESDGLETFKVTAPFWLLPRSRGAGSGMAEPTGHRAGHANSHRAVRSPARQRCATRRVRR